MLKNIHLFITIQLLIIAFSCNAMNEKTSILDQLIPKNACPQTAFITDDHVLLNVHYWLEHQGCYIVDLKKNILIKKIEINEPFEKSGPNNHYLIKMSLHPNKKLFSLCQCAGIALYDTETGTLQRSTKLGYSPLECFTAMSATEDTILFWNCYNSFITEWDYTTNQKHIINTQPQSQVRWITHHPKEHEVFVKTLDYQNIYNLKNGSIPTNMGDKKIVPPFPQYSPDGNFIAYCDKTTKNCFLEIMNTQTNEALDSYIYPSNSIKMLAFHPNNVFLATVSTEHNEIHYITILENIRKKTMLIRQPLSPDNVYFPYGQLVFSPNGKRVIINIKGKSILENVPFEVIYEPKTKKLLPYLLFLFKNYKIDEHNQLPQDIVHLLANTTLETLKY